MQSLGALGDRGTIDALARRWQLDPGYSFNISPEVSPTCDLGEMPELQFHMGWRRFGRAGGVGAVAAQVSLVQIANPAASGVMIVVEKFCLSTTSATEFVWDLSGAGALALGTLGSMKALDSRNVASSMGQISTENNATEIVPTSALERIAGLASTPYFLGACPLILMPGFGLKADVRIVNTAIDFSIVWRERRFNDQENTL